ncbi:MAG: alpha/beta fold hydrolase [Chloroflexi bacterium]|nr:alpha/beta fold hydrolase [Chloroflexota bacterium]
MNTKRWLNLGGFALAVFVVVAAITAMLVARQQAISLITITPEERRPYSTTPADFGMPVYEDIILITSDGLTLEGWYVPPQNGATIIMAHGFTGNRATMLDEMQVLAEAGYGLIAVDHRAHGRSEGELVTFGYEEQLDLEAAYAYLLEQPDVDPERIGVYGESMGASAVLFFAADNPAVEAVVVQTPYASITDTAEVSVQFFTGLPPFPFAPMIVAFAQQHYPDNVRARDIAPIEDVDDIAPRPVLLMVAGEDVVVSPEGWLENAESFGPHVELWYEPEVEHAGFSMPDGPVTDAFYARVLDFYANHLGTPR